MARKKEPKRVTRYEHEATDPVTPETGHSDRLADEETVVLDMDNGWAEGLDVARLETGETIVVDMDPAVDPVLMWSGKRSRREVPVLPLQRNEIVSASRIAQIIERARTNVENDTGRQSSLFADLEKELREGEKGKRVEFYEHEERWRNKLICGDSLEVMESLIRYEGLAGKVQMIYIDPPYAIDYDSNFQQRVDRNSNARPDGADDTLSVRAYLDTWQLGPHSFLTHLRDRLYLSRDLLSETGSLFLQIGPDQVHLVASLLDEVFGASNRAGTIVFLKSSGRTSELLGSQFDFLLWYAKDKSRIKFFQPYYEKILGEEGTTQYVHTELPDGELRRMSKEELANPAVLPEGSRILALDNLTSQTGSDTTLFPVELGGKVFRPSSRRGWRTNRAGMDKLIEQGRLHPVGHSLMYKLYLDDFPYSPIGTLWRDTVMTGFTEPRLYTVQTSVKVPKRAIAMTTDPGDLVLDPTCGSGTTAIAAEELGRRWITIDSSRVSTHVARARFSGTVFTTQRLRGPTPSHGMEYEEAPHVTLKSIARELEPNTVELRDRPVEDPSAIRVAGPFEVMTLGRYSLEDWKGYLPDSEDEEKLENYVEVICRLYESDSHPDAGSGLVHAVVDSEQLGRHGISVGPLTGRVTASQVHDAAKDAADLGLDSVDVLGWAFEANVGEARETAISTHKLDVELVMIRPDALAEGLKITKPEMLFSPLGMPEIEISRNDGQVTVSLNGLSLFNRASRETEYHSAAGGYVAAWYIDEDYDGDCFVDCQMFFEFKKAPNLTAAAGGKVPKEEFDLHFESEPFEPGPYRRIAVKVVDVYGNESTIVREL